MIALRFVLVVFNVAVITFLIYRLLQLVRAPMERSTKTIAVIAGIMLLLAPIGMFFGIFSASPQYFFVYPVAISLFLYMVRQL